MSFRWQQRLAFALVFIAALILLSPYSDLTLLTNDDFFRDPGHMYVRDGRWTAVPLLTFVDLAFSSQHVAKALGITVLALSIAAASVLLGRAVADRSGAFWGMAVVYSFAILGLPNFMWGPAIWYIALAVLGHAISAISLGRVSRKEHPSWSDIALWLTGLLVTYFAYQPLAVVTLFLWIAVSGIGNTKNVFSRAKNLVVAPLIGLAALGVTTVVLYIAVPSSRIESSAGVVQGLSDAFTAIASAYTRTHQLPLVMAAVVAVVGALIASRSIGRFGEVMTRVGLSGLGAVIVLAAGPILLLEGTDERFTTALLVAVVIGFSAILFRVVSVGKSEGRAPAVALRWFGLGPALITSTAVALYAVGATNQASALVVAVGVWVVLAAGVLAMKIPLNREVFTAVSIVALLLVSLGLVRTQVFDNRISMALDRSIADEVALSVAAMNFERGTSLRVSYEVVGDAPWYSTLLRTHNSGEVVLGTYLAALNPLDIEVVLVKDRCEADRDGLVETTQVSDSEVLVCVRFE